MAEIYESLPTIKLGDDAKGLVVGIPCRKTSPVEFWMHLHQCLHPLGVQTDYIIQKARETNVVDGALPAEARNKILERALQTNVTHTIFLDDDVLIPSITLYRLWVLAQQYPQAASITAVYTTKLTPTEPLIYKDTGSGAYWDWPLGALVPIHSAGAGCMIVNMSYVKKMKAPWFNDVLTPSHEGHDRHFHRRLTEEVGGKVYADTGLLVGHWDSNLQKVFFLPPNAPCFNRPLMGEAHVPFINKDNMLLWKRYIFPNQPDTSFEGYLDYMSKNAPQEQRMELIKSDPTTEVPTRSNDGPSPLDDWLRRAKGVEPGGGDQPDPGSNQP